MSASEWNDPRGRWIRRLFLVATLVAVAAVALAATGPAAAQTNVTGCGTLDTSGETYVLQNDITDAPSDDFAFECLDIDGSNIVLDGQGNTLASATAGDFEINRGITVNGGFSQSNVEIRNITIEGFERGGIYISGDQTLVENVTITNAEARGIRVSPQYQDSTNTVRNTVIDGVGVGNVVEGGDGFGINARTLSEGTSNTITNVTVRNTTAAALAANDKQGDAVSRLDVSGNRTSAAATDVAFDNVSSVAPNPAADGALGTSVELDGSGFAEAFSLFYDATDVPAGKVAAVWREENGTWTRLDTGRLGTAAGESFARVDRNVTAPSNTPYGAFVSDILPIEANFTASPAAPIEGQFVEFDASAANSPNDAIEEYRWEFGDGTTETTTAPTTRHSYDSEGDYTVTLEIEDGIGEVNSTSRNISVDRAEKLFDGGDGTTRTYQISNWTHLDNVRELPGATYEVIADIDGTTSDYESVANGTDTEFVDEFDSVLFPPEQKDLARAPVVASSVSATDTSDGSSVDVTVVDAQNGTIEITEETDGTVRVDYTTQTPATAGFDPIGGDLSPFDGTLDGNGYTIGDLFVEEKQTDVGLFGVLGSNGTVGNLTLVDANITVLGDFNQEVTGTLVGNSNGGTIENVSASGRIDAQDEVGGIVGSSRGGVIRNASAAVDITAEFSALGGLVGRLTDDGVVERSSATGDVRGDENQNGGLVGVMRDSATVRESYAAGDVGPVAGGVINRAGGLVGVQRGGTIVDTYAVGNVTGGADIGGLVGRTDSRIENSYAAGNVTASSGGGGLIGDSGFGFDTEAIDSYWDINTTGQDSSNSRSGGDEPLTTPEMKGNQAAVNMTGFDFTNTWRTVDRAVNSNTQEIAYPVLRNSTQIPEPGLERVSATDNFSVTVDEFTSVARPGETVFANVTVENVGRSAGTQTVTLSVNGTVESSTGLSLNSTETDTLSFDYTATEGDRPEILVTVASDNDSASRTVTVGNVAPSASNDSYTVERDTTRSVADPGVLENDTDPNGDALSVTGIVSGPSNGSVSVNASGSFEYTPDRGFLGQDSFTYEVTDGNATDTATVTVTVRIEDLRSIAYGQNRSGRIDDGDPSGFDGEYEPVTFGGAAGDNVTITMTSEGDTKLYLLAPNGTQIAVNDDSAELSDFNSRIKHVVLPETGTYTIVATSFSSGARFAYDLGLEATNTSAGNLSVSVDATNSPVTEGETLSVTTGVENVGSTDGAQVIQLEAFDGSVTDSQQVALGVGNTTTLALEWPTQAGDAGTGTVTVASENDTATEPATVEAAGQATFGVTVDDAPTSVTAGDTIAVNYTVENTGNAQGTQDITFEVNGTQEDANTGVTLNAGETVSETFSYTTASTDTPAVTTTVASENDSHGATVEVNAPANFAVTVDSPPASVTAGDTIAVNYTVENTGGVQETQDVTFEVNGTQEDANTGVTLTAGATLSDSFTYTTSSADEPQVTTTVGSDDDAASETVDVTAAAAPGLSDLDVAGEGDDAVVVRGADEPISVNVTNPESESRDIDVGLEITGGGQQLVTDSTMVGVGGGATERVRFDGVTGGLDLSSRNENYGVTVSAGGASLAGTLAVNPDLTGNGLPARDSTGDGLLDNVNGRVENGTQVTSIADVQALFESLGTPAVEEIAGRFDFSGLGDGRVSIFDVQALFYQRTSG